MEDQIDQISSQIPNIFGNTCDDTTVVNQLKTKTKIFDITKEVPLDKHSNIPWQNQAHFSNYLKIVQLYSG